MPRLYKNMDILSRIKRKSPLKNGDFLEKLKSYNPVLLLFINGLYCPTPPKYFWKNPGSWP